MLWNLLSILCLVGKLAGCWDKLDLTDGGWIIRGDCWLLLFELELCAFMNTVLSVDSEAVLASLSVFDDEFVESVRTFDLWFSAFEMPKNCEINWIFYSLRGFCCFKLTFWAVEFIQTFFDVDRVLRIRSINGVVQICWANARVSWSWRAIQLGN